MKGPIYTRIFVECKENERGAFKVFFPDFSGETEGAYSFLRQASFEEAIRPKIETPEGVKVYHTIYVEVQHDLKYPYSAWDCIEVTDDDDWYKDEPRRFCEATIVATPKAKLF